MRRAKAAESAGLTYPPQRKPGSQPGLPPVIEREHVDEIIDKLTIALNAALDFATRENLA